MQYERSGGDRVDGWRERADMLARVISLSENISYVPPLIHCFFGKSASSDIVHCVTSLTMGNFMIVYVRQCHSLSRVSYSVKKSFLFGS
jgi:hypothetical protein